MSQTLDLDLKTVFSPNHYTLSLRFAPAYLDGYSTFYVNSDNQIYQHTLDRVRQEQGENTNKTLIQRLLDLIGKQARVHQPV